MKSQALEIVLALFMMGDVDASRYSPKDAACLTEVIYHEARGESRKGQRAIAHVVLNRTKDPYFPDTICGVVHQRGQFSPKLKARARLRDPAAAEDAGVVAINALTGASRDPTGGATYFFSGPDPKWARRFRTTEVVGSHTFMKSPKQAGSTRPPVRKDK